MKNKPLANFCDHIAHILNTPVEERDYVACSRFRLEKEILQRLAHKPAYRTHIVGMPRMGGLCEASPDHCEQAAERWIKQVLKRPMKAKAGHDGAKSHELARLLQARATSPERRAEPRQLPDTMSVWDALSQTPPRMRLLKPDEKDKFFYVLKQAVEAAHVRWGRLVWIGLCPWSWPEETVTTNRAKTLGAFYNIARDVPPSGWPEVWKERRVTGFKTFEAFMDSNLGRELRYILENPSSPSGLSAPPDDPQDQVNWHDADVQKEMLETLRVLKKRNYISDFDVRLYLELYKGENLNQLIKQSWVREVCSTTDKLRKYTDKLNTSILNGVQIINQDNEIEKNAGREKEDTG